MTLDKRVVAAGATWVDVKWNEETPVKRYYLPMDTVPDTEEEYLFKVK